MTRRMDDSKASRERLVDALSALSRVLVAITARTLASLDAELTLPQYRVIVVLASRGPQRSIDLAAELGIHPSTVTRTCDRLVRRGLVQRRPVETDRRVSSLALTEQGKQLIGEVMRRRAAQIRALVPAGPIDDQMPVLQLLDAFVTGAGEMPEKQWWKRWAQSTAGTVRLPAAGRNAE